MGLCRARGWSASLRHRGAVQHRRTLPAHRARHACLLSMATPPRHPVANIGGRLGFDSRVHPLGATELHRHRHRHHHSYWHRDGPNGNNNLQRAPRRVLGRPVVQPSAPARPPARAHDGGCVRSPCEDGFRASTQNSGKFPVRCLGGTESSSAPSCLQDAVTRRRSSLWRVAVRLAGHGVGAPTSGVALPGSALDEALALCVVGRGL
jgi:hypothetical protein